MEKIINLKISNQKLTGSDICSVNRTVGLMYCQFEFDSTWNDYPVRLANFKRDTDPMSEAVTRAIINGRCRVPDELLKYKGVISVAVQGENTDGQIERTEPLQIIKQTQTITDGQNVIDPSPDQYTEFIERAGEAIEEYFEDHKSEFKGDPGEPGEPGEDYILTESDRQEIAGIAVEEISPVLAKKVERIRLTCDDSHIYLDEVQQNYEQVLAMVQDGTKYVTLLYADCISLQPHGWDGAAVYFMSSYINDNTAYIDRFIINNLDRCKFTETTLAMGDDLAELQGEVSSVKENLSELDNTKVGYSEIVNGQLLMYSDDSKEHLLAIMDLPSGGSVDDVTVNGTSVVSDGVAIIPISKYSKAGLSWVARGYGLASDENTGEIYLAALNRTLVDTRLTSYSATHNAITAKELDYAVKQAMCDGKGAEWTAQEQAMARKRIGEPQFELIEDFTTTEEVTTITRTAEPNGTPYSFSKMIIQCDFQNSQAKNRYPCVRLNDRSEGDSIYINYSYTPIFYATYEFDVSNGALIGHARGSNAATTGAAHFSRARFTNPLIAGGKITKVQIMDSVAKNIESGSRIKIYGIRA